MERPLLVVPAVDGVRAHLAQGLVLVVAPRLGGVIVAGGRAAGRAGGLLPRGCAAVILRLARSPGGRAGRVVAAQLVLEPDGRVGVHGVRGEGLAAERRAHVRLEGRRLGLNGRSGGID